MTDEQAAALPSGAELATYIAAKLLRAILASFSSSSRENRTATVSGWSANTTALISTRFARRRQLARPGERIAARGPVRRLSAGSIG
jgi:hypothetical protein